MPFEVDVLPGQPEQLTPAQPEDEHVGRPAVPLRRRDPNDEGQVLLIRRTDNGNWSLPGGGSELGESVGQAAIRETLEETGNTCAITGISGIYPNPNHVIEHTSDGEVRREFTIVLTGRPVTGAPTPSDESSHVEWVSHGSLDGRPMHDSMRARLAHAMSGQPPHLD